jgi:hypothetical protein
MNPELSYGKRLRNAAHQDFWNFWSSHRMWVTFSTLVTPFLIQAETHGWNSLLTLRETLESAAFALGLSLAGNCLIALWGGAKSLDAGLRSIIQQQEHMISDRDKQIQQDPAEEHHLSAASEIVGTLALKDKQVLMHLWTTGLLKGRRGIPQPIADLSVDEVKEILVRLSATPLVNWQRDRDYTSPYETWEIPVGYKNAIAKLLFRADPKFTPPDAS